MEKKLVLPYQEADQRCLKGRLQSSKKSATKENCKSLNGKPHEVKEVEVEPEVNHENERNFSDAIESTSRILGDIMLSTTQNSGNDEGNRPHKVSRAAKRREKKAATQRAQEKAMIKAKAEESGTQRSIEHCKLEQHLLARNLRIFMVPSDGDCLYSSIVHQLRLKNHTFFPNSIDLNAESLTNFSPTTLSTFATSELVKMLRSLTAEHIRENMDDFLPYMTNAENGEPLTLSEFEQYCDNIANTSAWGGQIELRALSNILKVPIEVLQADGIPMIIGEEFNHHLPITIVYHRHAFALGEHYNSCEPLEHC